MSAGNFRVFGLTFRSEIPLPAPPAEKTSPADVRIRRRPIDLRKMHHSLRCGRNRIYADSLPVTKAAAIRGEAGTFLVRNGREIFVEPSSHSPDWPWVLVALSIPLLLQQRGILVLHAACVRVGKGAVLFAGESGAGKSTLALALHAAGHALVSDDLTAIRWDRGRPYVVPGFPTIRMTRSKWKSLPDRLRKSFAPFDAGHRKPRYLITHPVPETPLPLRGICLLRRGRSVRWERREDPQEILAGLMLYAAQSGALRRIAPGFLLLQCSRLMREVPIGFLRRPWRGEGTLPADTRTISRLLKSTFGTP